MREPGLHDLQINLSGPDGISSVAARQRLTVE
jgi:hypothetical protein